MKRQAGQEIIVQSLLAFTLLLGLTISTAMAQEGSRVYPGNFGLPGIIDLPTARRLPDGEIVLTHQNHKYLFMNGISFQALPRLGMAFRYNGQGRGGVFAQGRVNWDRSFDAHISVVDESKYWPAISIGLRDFVGTGWYSSEYFVGTKSLGNSEITVGLGFGRLAGRNSFENPFGSLTSRFKNRQGSSNYGSQGGTLGNINWFQGDASTFYGFNYRIGKKILVSAEYTSDLMLNESSYMDIKSPWSFGASYKVNDYITLASQYLYESQISLTTHISVNPDRPPLPGGIELAPVPMRIRNHNWLDVDKNNEKVIRNVLAADQFKIHDLRIGDNHVWISVTNMKFRSNAQAVGRISSNLQRFTADTVKTARISFQQDGLQVGSYDVDLNKVTTEQLKPTSFKIRNNSITSVNIEKREIKNNQQRFSWGVGPYITHRLFNPDMPLSMEAGVELVGRYKLSSGLKLSGSVRKSVLTNLTDNLRLDSESELPRVHSSWPLYDIAGQSGHIHSLSLSYVKNLTPVLYGRAHAGLLEPFFAGIGGEILFKTAKSPFAIGLDLHRVRMRDYDMRFDLRDYETTVGHVSIYYDAGGIFDIEINAGRYLAGDVGASTTVSRKFGSGWEVGGYATLTDVPFDMFGEGSFDKAIYVTVPIDWITSSPSLKKRSLTIRPITRDGGAQLASARSLYRLIEENQNASLKREYGRLWK